MKTNTKNTYVHDAIGSLIKNVPVLMEEITNWERKVGTAVIF